ncbi:MAG: NYN domain-containing protein [Chloroflexi bacterium]|uniref:NYN domain-containing protein n=1 Tax=Candidatus Chlorohelix allophototropha TaxID=3003348 RepID=A0A8T7M1Z6_9CHLR|nr:NYN domain-containing protein [Chloroflexota bacterium]WJW66777.1 NYN domain-containing protein [Chloroflexota bacterium L227-S17]
MIVFVDGYNLMKTDPELALYQKAGLEFAREAVIKRVNSAAGLKKATSITIVFDGHLDGKERETVERKGRITVIYSKLGESADDVIKRMVAAHPQSAQVRVITRDSDLRSTVGLSGATPGMMKRRPVSPSNSTKKDDDSEDSGWNKSTRKKGQSKRSPRKKRGSDNDLYW